MKTLMLIRLIPSTYWLSILSINKIWHRETINLVIPQLA